MLVGLCDPDFWIFGGPRSIWGVRNLGIIFHKFFVGILKHIFFEGFHQKKIWDFHSMIFRGILTGKFWGFLHHDSRGILTAEFW